MGVGMIYGATACSEMGVEDNRLEEFNVGGIIGIGGRSKAAASQNREVDKVGRSSKEVGGAAGRTFVARCGERSGQMG